MTPRSEQGKSVWGARFWAAFAGCGIVLALAVPILNTWLPPNSAAALPDYLVPLLGKCLCYALLALSLDLIWGYAGILSLGHGAFFALGGYCMGMYLMRQIGTRGVYGNPVLPDFMVFLNWQELPWFWWGFDHLPGPRQWWCWCRVCSRWCSDGSPFARGSLASTCRSSRKQ